MLLSNSTQQHYPSFKATENGKLLPHIRVAFLKRFHLNHWTKPEAFIDQYGTRYIAKYEACKFFFNGPENATTEVIASFQKWVDGSCYCIVRPLNEEHKDA